MRSSIRFSFVTAVVSVAAVSGGCDSSDAGDPPIQYPDEGDTGSGPVALQANLPVVVTNTTAQAVPTRATGTTTVAGAVTASQDGTWDVSVAGGTVGASQSGPWSVGAAQEGAWSVGAKQEGPWTVDIGSSPPVSLAPGSSVAVGSMPPVAIAGVPDVNIASMPAVTIASMPPVAVSGTVVVGNTEDDEAIPVRMVGDGGGGGGGGGAGPTQTPWVGGGQLIIDPGETFESEQFTTPPPGKRLVIEYMTIHGSVPTGQVAFLATILATAPGQSATHRFPMQPAPGSSATFDRFSMVELTRINIRNGAGVIVAVERNASTGTGIFNVALSGYVVDDN